MLYLTTSGLGIVLVIITRKDLDMSKVFALFAILIVTLTGCTAADIQGDMAATAPQSVSATQDPNATVKYDHDNDGYIDFVVNTHSGCVTSVELFDINGEPTGYKLEQPAGAGCMDEATGIDTLMAFINETGGL